MPDTIDRAIDQGLANRGTVDVSIIIVNWNSIRYLEQCVASIHEQTRGLSFEIIVVDNASPAGDADLLENRLPGTIVVKSPVNLGFAGANNLGFKSSIGNYLLFLNPDTRLISPAINVLAQGIAGLPDSGILGCTLLNEDLSIQTSCIQTFPTILNQLLDCEWLRHRWPNSTLWGIGPLFSNSGCPTKVEVVSGACMMIGRDVFERVGLFTEDYFMYAEDLDLCYKTERAGYSNYYLDSAKVIHYGGKSSNPNSATEMKWKSIARFCEKHRGKLYAFSFRAAMASAAVGRIFAISVMRLFGKMSGTPHLSESSSTKWRLVLKVLLTPQARQSRFRDVSHSVPDCRASQS